MREARALQHVFNSPENEIFGEELTRSNLRSYLQETHFRYDFVPTNFISTEILESGVNHLKFNTRELAKIKQDFENGKNAMGYVESTYRIFRLDEDGNEDIKTAYHSSRNQEFSTYQDIDAFLQELVNSFNDAIEKSLTSEWSLKDVTNMTIYYTSITPRLGGNYIETPKWVLNKKCAVNVKNTDGRCLEYCILASIFKTQLSKVTDTALSKFRHHIKIPENQTYPIDIMRDVPKYAK